MTMARGNYRVRGLRMTGLLLGGAPATSMEEIGKDRFCTDYRGASAFVAGDPGIVPPRSRTNL